jgi:hypothetical protein
VGGFVQVVEHDSYGDLYTAVCLGMSSSESRQKGQLLPSPVV